jgi:uncharacterized protein YqiB (DUF1249 family)
MDSSPLTLSDHLCAISWRARPGSFVSLMTLYESNYIRLGWLLPDVRAIEGRHVSLAAGDLALYLEVTERCRYTTTLNLSYVLASDAGPVVIPDLQVRVYHDARLAEACDGAPVPRHEELRRLHASLRQELNERWARNVLLNKWLEYCAERGHRFPAPPIP